MIRLRAWTALAAAASLLACQPSAPARITLALGNGGAHDLALGDIDGFQVAVIDPDKAPSFGCGTVAPSDAGLVCLNASAGYASGNLVPLKKTDGDKTSPALYFSAALDGSGNQQLSVYGIPVGVGYPIVVEVRSKAGQLIGNSCTVQKQINAGDNSAELPAITLLAAGVPCDPRIE